MRTMILFCLLSLTIGCSQSEDQSPCPGCDLPELNETQKVRMARVTGEVTAIGEATRQQLKPKATSDGLLAKGQGILRAVANRPETLNVEQKTALYTSTLETAIQNGTCVLKVDGPHETSTGSEQNQTVTVRLLTEILNGPGKSCPLQQKTGFEMNATGTVSGQQAQIKGTMKFSDEFIVPEESSLHPLVDVLAGRTQGSLNYDMRVTQQSGVNSTFNGTFQSEYVPKSGLEEAVEVKSVVDLRLSARSEDQVSGSLRLVITSLYSDFTAVGVLDASVTASGVEEKVSYQINGRPVSEEEFLKLFPTETLDSALDEVSEQTRLN